MTEIGDVVTLDFEVRVDGVLTNADVTLTVTLPDGDTTDPSVTNDSTGVYHADLLVTQNGRHTYTWTSAGAAIAVQSGAFWVGVGVTVEMVRDRLNKELTVDDAEIEGMLDAALIEYEQFVGPVAGSVTETHHGGGSSLILNTSHAATLVSAVYSDGTVIDTGDLDLDTSTGIVYWGYNTAGVFTRGTRNVTVTYSVGSVPANHREMIAADVAGYFAATQRGPAGRPGEGYEAGYAQNPLVLFPRIRSLATPSIA